MNAPYRIIYHEAVVRDDLPRIPATVRQRVRRAIEQRLTSNPALYGKPLRTSLHGYRRLRVGDWRVVYRIETDEVRILALRHRSDIYDVIVHRI